MRKLVKTEGCSYTAFKDNKSPPWRTIELEMSVCDSCETVSKPGGWNGDLLVGLSPGTNAVYKADGTNGEGWFKGFVQRGGDGAYLIQEPIDYCPKCAPHVLKLLSGFNRELYRRP